MTLGTYTVITGHKVIDESLMGEHLPSTRKKEHNMKFAFCPINLLKQQRYKGISVKINRTEFQVRV